MVLLEDGSDFFPQNPFEEQENGIFKQRNLDVSLC